MIVENLKGSCVDFVARELARPVYASREAKGDTAWFQAIDDSRPAAIDKINGMTNMELLDLMADVLASE